jgi:hypothetical protein
MCLSPPVSLRGSIEQLRAAQTASPTKRAKVSQPRAGFTGRAYICGCQTLSDAVRKFIAHAGPLSPNAFAAAI